MNCTGKLTGCACQSLTVCSALQICAATQVYRFIYSKTSQLRSPLNTLTFFQNSERFSNKQALFRNFLCCQLKSRQA